ncbi:MAG: D-glycero-beta-D-manno-heptose-7-phosphate kinase [Gemmatimonadetes bacterium]|nr:D-glycero-beta-D-manno-heptose-7-phosphate kinase [Gemmatimonadota bacterium]
MDRLTPERAGAILERAGDARVVVVGDLMLDQYLTGLVDRISPEAPVPVVRVEEESFAVGGAANVAHNVVALGGRCQVVGVLGTDPGGDLLRRALEVRGIGPAGRVATRARPTPGKTRVRARRQQVVRFDRERDEDVSDDLARALAGAVEDLAADADALVMEDYNKGVLVPSVIRAVVDAAAARGLPTVVDPKRLRFWEYGGVTVFKPNAKELADALGEPLRPDDPDWMEEVRRRLSSRHLLLTLGERGLALRTETGESLRIPAVARSVYDVSGAGDTVTAVVAIALAAGATPVEAAILANHAAALEVAKTGVATVSRREILDQHRAFHGPPAPTPRMTEDIPT